LTDEREELTNTFKEENQELRVKVEALEEHINELNDELNNKFSRDAESEGNCFFMPFKLNLTCKQWCV
jgi:cell division protein FtsB